MDQKKALLSVEFFLKSNDNFYLLVGNAGTGKTTIAENIATYANADLLAPTNAAVKRLKDKFLSKKIPKGRFHTLHSILYGVPDEDTGAFVGDDKKGFVRQGVYIIDEASMIDETLLNDIIVQATKKWCKIIFMGDDFQLEPVSKDPHLFNWEDTDSVNFKSLQRIKLNEVKRNDGNILKVATHLRCSNGVQILGLDTEDFSIVNKFSSKIVKDIRSESSYAILVSTNKKRVEYNEAVRKVKYPKNRQFIMDGERLIAVANNLFPNGEQYTILKPHVSETYDVTINVGSRKFPKQKRVVMYLVRHLIKGRKGNYSTLFIPSLDLPSLHAMQLMTGKDVYNDPKLTIFDKRIYKRVWKSEINIATYGYSVSVHKSQGNEWDNVYIDADWLSPSWNKARWMYTAITRAKSRVELKKSNQFQIVKDE